MLFRNPYSANSYRRGLQKPSWNPVFYLHRSFHTIRLHHVLPRLSLLPRPDAVYSSLNLLQGTHR